MTHPWSLPPSLDFDQLAAALQSPRHWIELAVIAACVLVAAVVDRRVRLTTGTRRGVVRLGMGGVNRLLFPMTALLMLLLARALTQRWFPPLFLNIVVPLLVALALIRLCVYALRGLLGSSSFLPASERAISFTIWLALALYFVGVLPEIAAALDDTQLEVGKHKLSLLEVAKAGLVVLLTLVVLLWLSGLIERRLSLATHLDTSVRALLAKLIRAILLVVGLLVAMSSIGVDLTLLSVFGGALGVGIGLGLQKLASNYIAGVTILLDRSIRLGDMVTVDGRFGAVTKVTARYVVVRSLNGVEAIVPNETLIVTTVLNHTNSSKDVRLDIPIQIPHGTDAQLVLRLLEEAARDQPGVATGDKAPVATLVGFAPGGLNVELTAWIDDAGKGQNIVRSQLNMRIHDAFKANNIELPRQPPVSPPPVAESISST